MSGAPKETHGPVTGPGVCSPVGTLLLFILWQGLRWASVSTVTWSGLHLWLCRETALFWDISPLTSELANRHFLKACVTSTKISQKDIILIRLGLLPPTFPSPLSQYPTWNGIQMWSRQRERLLAQLLGPRGPAGCMERKCWNDIKVCLDAIKHNLM